MGKKLTEYSELTSVSDLDLLMVVDRSDTTQDEDGSTKKIKRKNLVAGLATESSVTDHTSDTDNPHEVTKTQVGLGNVSNVNQVPLSYLDTDGTLANDSDIRVATQKASKTYVDTTVDTTVNAAYRFLKRTIYTSGSGTFTKDSRTRLLDVQVQGGGGGGAGATGGSSQVSSGGGGKGGGYCRKLVSNPNNTYAYAVGAGGAGGANSSAGGEPGGNSTFGSSFLTANGGGSGTTMAAGTSVLCSGSGASGSQGGSATGGDINIPGGEGERGLRFSSTVGLSGRGGDSVLGKGGCSTSNVGFSSGLGDNGVGYGGGGSGGNANLAAARAGGAGSGGIIIVDEYI